MNANSETNIRTFATYTIVLVAYLRVTVTHIATARVTIVRTDSDNQDFMELIKYLDVYLAEKDRNDYSFDPVFGEYSLLARVWQETNMGLSGLISKSPIRYP
jgi:hypothetical protein